MQLRTGFAHVCVIFLLAAGLMSAACAARVPVAYPLSEPVTLVPPYISAETGAPSDRISVQYAVIAVAGQVGLGYDWDTSYKNTNPICRTWIRPKIKAKSCHQALEKILKPVHLTYSVKAGKIVLERRKA